jgi:hypothetical protein
VGKTTIARLMADAFDALFIAISATLGGVRDIRDAVDAATRERDTTLQRMVNAKAITRAAADAAKLEPIKMTVQKNCRLCFFWRFNLKHALYHFSRLGEVSILENFDGVYLSLGQLRNEPCAVLFIVRELDTFDSILRVLFPLELG